MRLPTFLVIGAAKGGTTSLHFYLRQHPDIFLTPVKETNYYWAEGRNSGRRIPNTFDEYARLFAGATSEQAVGEISPRYLNSPTAAARIERDLPDVRLVVSLRNPADRAYSDYLGRVRIGRESRNIDLAVRPGERIYEDGFYYPRLERYFERFSPERIHVLLYDDFASDSRAALGPLFDFIGVDRDVRIDTSTRHNPAEMPRSMLANRILWKAIALAQAAIPSRWRGSGRVEKLLRRTYRKAPKCPRELRRRLRDAYRDDVMATARLIGRDLSRWLEE